GGTGFVGMNVTRALACRGHDVIATRRARANTLFARKLGAKLIVADLDDVDSLTQAMKGRQVVFHCAGFYPRYSLNIDEQVSLAQRTTRHVIEAARRACIDRLVVTSSVATIGPPRQGRVLSNESDEMSADARDSVYFASKEAIERVALETRDLDVVVTCPGGIVGELDVKAGTGFIIVALAHRLLPFYVQGKTNIVDADDMAEGHLAAAERGRKGQRYILGGHNTTIKDLLLGIGDELGIRFTSWPMPLAIAKPMATFDEMRCAARGKGERPFIPREFVDIVRFGQWVDTERSMSELALREPTPLHITIQKACAWYERYRYIPRRLESRSVGESPSLPRIFAASSHSKSTDISSESRRTP
ncbi:MAG TPA: NAD-dependent epimerase/dehydratase family protein, partial [Polyangiaceae bacterium]|nr:NAD-dependent epimerase/dehydratase family protein [Polyangiaceae bacterium]